MTPLKEVRLIGSRILSTRLGKQVVEHKVFETYCVPILVAQDIIKATGNFDKQLNILCDCLDAFQDDGYWIATTDCQDERDFMDFYKADILDQYITKVVHRGSGEFDNIHSMHTSLGATNEPYSYILISETPESTHANNRVAELNAEEYDLELQVA